MVVVKLLVNEREEEEIYLNDIIVFLVSITNPEAEEAKYHNEMIDRMLSELEERYKAGEISEDEYKAEKERLEKQKVEVKAYTIGSPEQPWYKHIQFQMKSNDQWIPLNWDLKVIYVNPEDPVLQLNGVDSAYVTFSIAPDDVNKIPEGSYHVKVYFLESESNTVKIKLLKKVKRKPSIEKLAFTARYLIYMKRYDDAKARIDRLLKLQPDSIEGNLLLGEFYEEKGDIDNALKYYTKARDQFYKHFPEAIEPPRYVESKISRLLYLKYLKEKERQL